MGEATGVEMADPSTCLGCGRKFAGTVSRVTDEGVAEQFCVIPVSASVTHSRVHAVMEVSIATGIRGFRISLDENGFRYGFRG